MRPFPKETLKSLRDYYRVGLTNTSNALEGNSLTESETKVVIEDGLTIGGKPLRDVYEATGHAKAYDHLYSLVKDNPITEEDILELHRLFSAEVDPEHAGSWRQVRVFISGSRRVLPAPEKVPECLPRGVYRDTGKGWAFPGGFRSLYPRSCLRDAEGASQAHG